MDYRMPIYLQIKDAILKKIKENEYLPGDVIPSERKLAETYEVSRMTVKYAIDSLVDEGYLYRVPSKGTFVQKENTQRIIWEAEESSGLGALLKESGASRKDKVIVKGLLKAYNYIGSKLNLANYEDVYVLHRIRYANDEPFAVEYCYLPFKYFEDIDKHNFEHTSVYAYMKSKDHLPIYFEQKLIIIESDERLSKLLEIPLKSPLYYIEFIGIDNNKNIIEYTESYINCEKTVFTYETKRDYKKVNMR